MGRDRGHRRRNPPAARRGAVSEFLPRARVAIVTEALLPQFLQVAGQRLRHLNTVIVAGTPAAGMLSLELQQNYQRD